MLLQSLPASHTAQKNGLKREGLSKKLMEEKYDVDYERKIKDLANNRLRTGTYKLFDHSARVIKRRNFPDLKEKELTDNESCLVIINRQGECVVITR